MRTLKLTIAYLGTHYFGWQRQTDEHPTIQASLEHALAQVVQQHVAVEAAGRTDRGVHALGQVAHVRLDGEIAAERVLHGTNHHLPADIRLRAVEDVPHEFHARKQATGKTYRYTIETGAVRLPWHAVLAAFEPRALDADAMDRSAQVFVGTHDFNALCTQGHGKESTVRTVRACGVARRADQPELIDITVRGDGFLWNQVRTMAGTLVEVGLNKRSVAECVALLRDRDRKAAGPNMPPEGLMLMEVRYDGPPRPHPDDLVADPLPEA